MHIPELGIVSKNRKNLATTEDYKGLFGKYTKTLLEKKTISATSAKPVQKQTADCHNLF